MTEGSGLGPALIIATSLDLSWGEFLFCSHLKCIFAINYVLSPQKALIVKSKFCQLEYSRQL